MTKPIWIERNLFLKEYDLDNKKVIDFGCGDKSICNYFKFKEYIGIDKKENADIQIDFNQNINLNLNSEIGLILGVLEYLKDPNMFLSNIKNNCETFIILVLAIKAPKLHHGWLRVYNEDNFTKLLSNHFNEIELKKYGKYLIAKVK